MTMTSGSQDAVYDARAGLIVVMEDVTETRGRQGRKHLLTDILLIAVLGSLCGCDDAEALEDWGLKEKEWLDDFLELPYGIPSQDTYLRVLAAIDEREFRHAFMTWAVRTFPRAVREGHIAIDGRTARRSGDKEFEKNAVHMVSALACEHGVVIAQQPTASKSNELNAIRALLDLFELKGSFISIDAMGCQRDVAKKIVTRGGDYLFTLKKNHKKLRTSVIELFEAVNDPSPRPVDVDVLPTVQSFQHVDAGHGRVETRVTHVLHEWGDWGDWVPES